MHGWISELHSVVSSLVGLEICRSPVQGKREVGVLFNDASIVNIAMTHMVDKWNTNTEHWLNYTYRDVTLSLHILHGSSWTQTWSFSLTARWLTLRAITRALSTDSNKYLRITINRVNFVFEQAIRYSPRSMKNVWVTFDSFVRHLHLKTATKYYRA